MESSATKLELKRDRGRKGRGERGGIGTEGGEGRGREVGLGQREGRGDGTEVWCVACIIA